MIIIAENSGSNISSLMPIATCMCILLALTICLIDSGAKEFMFIACESYREIFSSSESVRRLWHFAALCCNSCCGCCTKTFTWAKTCCSSCSDSWKIRRLETNKQHDCHKLPTACCNCCCCCTFATVFSLGQRPALRFNSSIIICMSFTNRFTLLLNSSDCHTMMNWMYCLFIFFALIVFFPIV